MEAKEQYLPALRQFVAGHPEYGITRIGIFGSVARGEQTDGSDLDVLVEAPALSLPMRVGIKLELEELFGIPVDVVRKSEYMPPRFRARVERDAVYA